METGRLFDFWQEYPEAPQYFRFLEEYIDSLTNENPTDNLSEILKNYQHLEFSIKIRGANWNDDYVDATIAKYVLAMQESLNDILEDYEIPKNTILIKVKIEKGCKKIIANLEGLINSLRAFCNNMSGGQKLIFCLICLAGFSAWEGIPAYKDYMIAKQEAKRAVLIQKSSTDATIESLKAIDNAIEALKEVAENKSVYDKPYRIIERELEESDKIAINNDSSFISKSLFAETLRSKRNPRREFENKYLDGEFHIVDIYADKEIEV